MCCRPYSDDIVYTISKISIQPLDTL